MMVVRRVLTFVLAGILAVETPATAYAIEQTTWQETIDGAVDDGGSEQEEGGEAFNDCGDGAADMDEGSAAGVSDDGAQTGKTDGTGTPNDDAQTGEADSTGTPNDDAQTGEADGTGMPNDDAQTGEADSTGTPDDDAQAGETDSIGTPDDDAQMGETDSTDTSDDSDAPDDGTGIEETDAMEEDRGASDLGQDAAISSNAVPYGLETAAETVTEIPYAEAVTDGVTIDAPDRREGSAWYAFTAPEAGRYAFYTDTMDCAGDGDIYVNLCTALSTETKNHWAYFDPTEDAYMEYCYLWLATDYMEAGETVYVETYVEDAAGRTFTMKVAAQTEVSTDEDGGRSLTHNGSTLTVRTLAGSERLRFEAQVDTMSGDGMYFIRPYWCPADHSRGDLDVVDKDHIIRTNLVLKRYEADGGIESKPVTPQTAYEVAYMVMYTPKNSLHHLQFVALLAGEVCETKERELQERVQIHDAVCTDHAITLELEPFSLEGDGKRTIGCYYAPADGSEAEQSVQIDQYKQYHFDGLLAGTAYRFEFRTSQWGDPLRTATYETTGDAVSIRVSDYSIALSEDFRVLTVRAKTDYRGDGKVWLYGSIRDELGNQLSLNSEMSKHLLPEQDAGETGDTEDTQETGDGNTNDTQNGEDTEATGEMELYYGIEIGTRYAFLPGQTYQTELWITFREECITTEHQLVTMQMPEQALYGEEDITLQVTQDSETKTTVHCAMQIPEDALGALSPCYVYYRPVGGTEWQSKYVRLDSEYKGNLTIEKLLSNTAYEFALCLGGCIKRCRLDLNTSGIALARVEDPATDCVKPYDFVHTYRLSGTSDVLTGTYYLQMQYTKAGTDGTIKESFVTELNAENAYQTVFSSVERMYDLLLPDTTYELRWMVGRSKSLTKENALCLLYETMTTAAASPLQIEETGYMKYRVTFHEADVANLQAHDKKITARAMIRQEGAPEAMLYSNQTYEFTPDNHYSQELSGLKLAFQSRYELQIGGYATGILEVGEELLTLQVESVNVMVNAAEITYTITGADPQKMPSVVFYSRKVGDVEWNRSGYTGRERYTIVLEGLQSGTEYEYGIGLGASVTTPLNELTNRREGSFTTMAETREITVLSVRPRMADVTITCMLSGMAGVVSKEIFLLCYYRPVAETAWRRADSVQFRDQNKVRLQFAGLTKETAYEYIIGFGRYSNTPVSELGCATACASFTTTPDRREAIVLTATCGIHRAQLECAVSGVENDGYLLCYLREDEKEPWQRAAVQKVQETTMTATFQLGAPEQEQGLQEHTRYQYRIGFGDAADTEAEALEPMTEGDFTTATDTRTAYLAVTPKVISAELSYTLSGMEGIEDAYLCGYLKEAEETDGGDIAKGHDGEDTGDAAWRHQFSEPVGAYSTDAKVKLAALEAGVSYVLTVGFGSRTDCGMEQLENPQTLTFTTLLDTRKVSGAEAVVQGNTAVLHAFFEGNVEPQPSYILFFYKTEDETAYQKAGYGIHAGSVEARECSTTVTGLVNGKRYEFAAVLSDTSSGVKDPATVINPDWKTTGSFETAPAVLPASLALSQEQLHLNTAEAYREEKSYGYEELKITWTPAQATKDCVWESSDPEVVTVSEDGKVSAVASGTAQVTAASFYAPTVTATCEVITGDYRIGYPETDGMRWLDTETLTIGKGQRAAGCGLYDLRTGTPVLLSGVTVVSDNEAVAAWESGEIVAGQVGRARLVFTAQDAVRAYMTVEVQPVSGRGFALIGFTSSNASYPAVREETEGGTQYTLACKNGLTYTAVGEIVPAVEAFGNSDFTWTIDNTAVAEVSEEGVVTPKTAGTATLRVTPKETADHAPYLGQTCEVALLVKELPSEQLQGASRVYALANLCKKIGDVVMPKEEAWDGWEWQEPNTPLVINGVNRAAYPFRAVYTGEAYYPEEKTIYVYIGKVTGVSVTEEATPGHNRVIEVSETDEDGNPKEGADCLTLTAESICYGSLHPDEETNYYFDMDITAPAGVYIQKKAYRQADNRLFREFDVTAVKKGSYTLTAVIKVRDRNNSHEKILAKTTYKLKAVTDSTAYVKLVPETTAYVYLDDGRIVIDSDQNVGSFLVRAELSDRNNETAEHFGNVKLAWSVTDQKVATVRPAADTHSAEVKVKGEGHTILTVKVKDPAGHTDALGIEIQNRMPRVSTDKAVVNLAYDYDSEAGRNLARTSSGLVEVVPAYGDAIKSMILYDSDKETLCTDLRMLEQKTGTGAYELLLRDSQTTKTGVYECCLGIRMAQDDRVYYYPLRVTVKEQQAKFTVKSVRAANLFYRSDPASVDLTGAGISAGIESVVWEADSADENHGFSASPIEYAAYDTTRVSKNARRYYFGQGDIALSDRHKPEDGGVFSGQIKVKVQGYKMPNAGMRVTLKWNYKKPVIVTKPASATLLPTVVGHDIGRFDLYHKTDQKTLLFSGNSYTGGSQNPKYYYNEMISESDAVEFLPNSNTLGWRRYRYIGSKTKGSEKITLSIRNMDWREVLYVVHTVKLASPVPYLTRSQLTMNTTQTGTAYTEIGLKNAYDTAMNCDSIRIEGANQKAKALLIDDLVEIRQDSAQKDRIVVKLNRAQTMGQTAVKSGTYSYKVTPCYTDAYGNAVQGKTLTLKLKVTNKAVTAKVKTSGKLDLTKETATGDNYISLKTTFQNIGSDYTIQNSKMRLYGEYSDYFDLKLLSGTPGAYRLRIKGSGKLKAGQRYRLALGFTIEMENGDTFTVRSQTFTVTPRQSQPKIRITDNNQTLYASADTLRRTYHMEILSEGGYTVKSVSGSLDCNKDGRADVSVTGAVKQADDGTVSFTLQLTDRDGVMTGVGAKGRTYTIPVVVQLQGRDGITKDLKTKIKVTVKK